MERVSRRSLLGTVAAGASAAVAGCSSGLLGTGDGSNGDEAVYEEWLAADLLRDVSTGMVFYADVQTVRTDWPDDVTSEFGFDSLTTSIGVDADDLDGMIAFQTGETSTTAGMSVVLTGSFEKETLVGNVSAGMETETHGDFEVAAGMIAISSDAVIMSQKYDALIAARNGDGDRITDVDDTWDEAVGNVAGSALSGVILDANQPFDLIGLSMDADGSEIHLDAYAHYPDAKTAEEEKATAENETRSFAGNGEIENISVDGNVVVVEAVMTDVQL